MQESKTIINLLEHLLRYELITLGKSAWQLFEESKRALNAQISHIDYRFSENFDRENRILETLALASSARLTNHELFNIFLTPIRLSLLIEAHRLRDDSFPTAVHMHLRSIAPIAGDMVSRTVKKDIA